MGNRQDLTKGSILKCLVTIAVPIIGTQLMHALIGECRGRGVHALVACITAGNEPSCRLHRRLGFRQVSEFHEVGFKHGQWLDVVDSELRL